MDKPIEEQASEILRRILDGIGYEYTLEQERRDDLIYFHIDSPEAGRLIGRKAQMIQALQFLLNRMVRRISKDAPKCIVDVEHYRKRRKEKMVTDALEAAEEVKDTGEEIRLKPMNSFDRRAVHRALSDDEEVETSSVESKGSSWKSVVISPVDVEEEEEEEEEDDYDDYEEEGENDEEVHSDPEEQPKENTL